MNLWLRCIGAIVVVACASVALSCGYNHDLQFIDVKPGMQTLTVGCTGPAPTDCAPTTQYKALGHYIHPPDVHDITNQVQWQTTSPDLITFADPSQPGLMFPTGVGCGTNLQVLAVVYEDPKNPSRGKAHVGSATVSINCSGTGTGGGGGTPDFTLSPANSSQSVAPGGTANYTINVTAVSGSPTVQLNVNTNTLPAGISFTLSPTSVTATGTATLTLTASSSLAAGAYQVQILGQDSSGGSSTTVTLNVT
jgi:hypothetical protein